MSAVKRPGGPNSNTPAFGAEGPGEIPKGNPNKPVAQNTEAGSVLTKAMEIALSFLPTRSPKMSESLKNGKISAKKADKAQRKVDDSLAEINFGVRNVDRGPLA